MHTTRLTSPSNLLCKTFKFGKTKVWVKSLHRDDIHRDEWAFTNKRTMTKAEAERFFQDLVSKGWWNG